MRRSVLALATAGSLFALTSAFAAGTMSGTNSTVNSKSFASEAVTLNTCNAATADFSFGLDTTEGADYGKVDTVVLTLANPAGLTGCATATLQIGNGDPSDAVSFVTDVDGKSATATFGIAATDAISTVSAVITAGA